MKITTSKSKNSESFYITQSYIDSNGRSTSKRIRKLGTLKELTETLGTDRDGVMEWAREQARLETENYKISQDEQSGYISIYDKKAGTGVVMRSVQDLAVQKDIATGTKVLIRDFGSGFYCVVRVTDELEGALKKALQTDVLREKELTGFKVHTDQKTGIHYITANGYEGRGGILLLDDQGREKLVSMAEEYMSQYPQLIKSMDEAIMFAAFEISGVAKRKPNGILKLGPNSLSFYDKNGKDGWQILFDELDYELYRKEWDKGKNTDEIESKGYWESI